MFPFGNSSNGNPILHCSVPPSFQSSNSSFLGINGNQILLHQHQDHHYLAPNAQLIDNNSTGVFATNNVVVVDSDKSNKIKKSMKKDRHSKILTSQGHRDRRVRLSIGVARKFFDLQDMLGFDKPSKTLDWLFTKSKLAVDKLTHDKNANKRKTSTTSSSIEVDVVVVPGKQGQKEEEAIVARDSRAKARARARERTIKKIWSQIETKSNTSSSVLVNEQPKMEGMKNMIHHPNIKSASTSSGFHCPVEVCCYSTTRNWDRTVMTSGLSVATNICCTSSQVQKAWDSYHGNQI